MTCYYRFHRTVKLTVFLRNNRTLSSTYDRLGAALRLKFARRLPDFVGYNTEDIK